MLESSPIAGSRTGRIAQLDGIRGVAIVMVLLWHYVNNQLRGVHGGAAMSVAAHALSIMWSGVDLFFVLSGFLIIGILAANRNSSHYFRTFYLRRVCRIFPIYYLVLAAFVVVTQAHWLTEANYPWLLRGPYPLWSYASFTQNVFMGRAGDWGAHWLAPTWSLAVEEQFYLIAPLLVYLLPRRILLLLCLSGIACAPLLRAGSPGMSSFVNLPFRADSLLLGAVLALMVRTPGFTKWADGRRWWLLALAAALVGAAVLLHRINLNAYDVLCHTLLGLVYVLMILLALLPSLRVFRALLSSPVLVWLGLRSYGIYLFHEPVSGILHGGLSGLDPIIAGWRDVAVTFLALCVTLGLAALSYRFIEQPCVRFGQSFKYGARELDATSLAT